MYVRLRELVLGRELVANFIMCMSVCTTSLSLYVVSDQIEIKFEKNIRGVVFNDTHMLHMSRVFSSVHTCALMSRDDIVIV